MEVRQARALYENMAAKIVEDGYESEIVEFAQGIPQGGPRSGKLFALYNSDLPDALRKVGAGTVVGEVEITCATFLDDSVVPTLSEPWQRPVHTVPCSAEGTGGLWSQMVAAVVGPRVQDDVRQCNRPPAPVAIREPLV